MRNIYKVVALFWVCGSYCTVKSTSCKPERRLEIRYRPDSPSLRWFRRWIVVTCRCTHVVKVIGDRSCRGYNGHVFYLLLWDGYADFTFDKSKGIITIRIFGLPILNASSFRIFKPSSSSVVPSPANPVCDVER